MKDSMKMYSLRFYLHGHWQVECVADWKTCLDLGHSLFGQKIVWEIV